MMRWLGKDRLRFLRGQRGISLIEVLVAVALLAIIGTFVIRAYDTNYRATRALDEQVTAKNLTAAYIEAIKQSAYAVDYTSATADIAIPFQYTVNVNVLASTNGVDYFPATGNPDETLQKIVISVAKGGKPVLAMCTLRAKR